MKTTRYEKSRYSTLLRILLALVALAGILYWAADTRDRFELGLHLDRHARDPFKMNFDTRQVTSLEAEAERAGLVKGATIESLNGAPYTGQAQWAEIVNPAAPGEQITVTFRRPDGSSGTAQITLATQQPLPGLPIGLGQVWRSFLLFGLMPFICMLIGYWVVFAKPDEPNAWLLLVLLLFPEVVFALGTGWATGGWLFFRGRLLSASAELRDLRPGSLRRLLPRTLTNRHQAAVAQVGGARACLRLRNPRNEAAGRAILLRRQFPAVYEIHDPGRSRRQFSSPWLCVIFYLVFMTDKLLSASTEDARRRLRILLVGTGTGLGALLIAFVLLPDLGFSFTAPGHGWVAYTGAALFLLAPLALAYVVLVQRAMDVSILVRQGTKYALAKATLLVIQFALAAVVTYRFLIPLLTQKQIPRDQLWQAIIFIILIFLIRLGFNKRTQNWLDKKFFREAYDTEQVLNELSDEVRKYTESGPLLQTVAKCVAETLHVTQIGMLLRDGPKFCVAQAIGGLSR